MAPFPTLGLARCLRASVAPTTGDVLWFAVYECSGGSGMWCGVMLTVALGNVVRALTTSRDMQSRSAPLRPAYFAREYKLAHVAMTDDVSGV